MSCWKKHLSLLGTQHLEALQPIRLTVTTRGAFQTAKMKMKHTQNTLLVHCCYSSYNCCCCHWSSHLVDVQKSDFHCFPLFSQMIHCCALLVLFQMIHCAPLALFTMPSHVLLCCVVLK